MKKIVVPLICAVCFVFCSCTADTSGESFEITSENWYGKLKGGAEVSLNFSDNQAELKLKSGEDEMVINGLYVNYTVSGNKLVLDYCGKQIEIEKQGEN